ncbi:metallopeptidase TldD-related protein [Nakamurella flava]|uniref:metallopeptidase TldD-related protein n=1 Tax=Nakamurella flava TaxID=2576308 RepID=UPI001F107187|nr:metallopeptidase TldD-related protein [Nakamurella flava]
MSAESGLLTPEQIVESALAASRADGCVVVVTVGSEANVRWANNTVTTNGVSAALSWYVVSVVGAATGVVAASAAAAGSARDVAAVVRESHEAARAAAAAGPARDARPLVEPDASMPDGGVQDLAEPPAQTSFGVYSGLLEDLGAAFGQARATDRILYGFARHEVDTVYLGSSTGLRRRWVQPTGSLELNAKSADLTRSSWAGVSTADFTDVDLTAMDATLTRRLDWARRRVDLPPGRYDTVLPPTAVADFMVYLAWSAGGRPAHEGRSVFSKSGGGTRIGERLTDRALTVFGDPGYPGLAAQPFVTAAGSSDEVSVFDNGAPVGRVDLVRDGVISGLLHTRASAAEYAEPFAPPVDNVVVTGGDPGRSIDDIVAGVDRGLLVTSQWYLREVDPMTLLLTGLTRDGVFLVERGEVVGAVTNFRFNMSPLDVLRQAVDVGATVPTLSREWSDWFTRSAMPPILVQGFNMSSVSQAQ